MAGAKDSSDTTKRDRQKSPGTAEAEQESYDETVAESFPASDPPASSGITGPGRAGRPPPEKQRGS
jgi:hypothetical protein